MAFQIRPSLETDKCYLRDLHKACYMDVVTRQFGSWNDQVQRQFFENKWDPNKFQIVELDGHKIGMISCEDREEYVFLGEIQIHPSFQRRGYGSSIIKSVLVQAQTNNKPLRLQVLKANLANQLYFRLGFLTVGETDTHYLMEIR